MVQFIDVLDVMVQFINTQLILCCSKPGAYFNSATIGVGTEFHGSTGFNPTTYTTCATGGATYIENDCILLQCSTPTRGRYVTIYLVGSNRILQLCNVRVFTAVGES